MDECSNLWSHYNFVLGMGTVATRTRRQMRDAATTQSTTASNLLEFNDPILCNITSYLPNTDLMQVALVSKRTHTNDNSEEYLGGLGRLNQLVHQLQQHCVRDPNLFQHYQHASMMD